jgi:hypothetical protein
MGRQEIPTLVSRALAVWCCGHGLNIVILALSARPNDPSPLAQAPTMSVVVSSLVWVALALLLWFRASSFGTWLGKEPEEDRTSIVDKESVGTGLFQAAGLYWLISSLALIATGTIGQPRIPDQVNLPIPVGPSVLAGASLVVVYSRLIARSLCKA